MLSFPILLAGCQHPQAPSVALEQPYRSNHAFVQTKAVVLVDKSTQCPTCAVKTEAPVLKASAPPNLKSIDAVPIAGCAKQEDCLTGQLADGLMNVFKTFTGR